MEGEELHQLSMPDASDASQERELAKLEGRKPRGASTRRYTSHRLREYGYGTWPGEDAEPLFMPARPEAGTVEAIIAWTLAQEREVALAVFEYLDDPQDAQLSVIQGLAGVTSTSLPAKREGTLSSLILRSLPASLDALYDLARREHLSRRPEAAVRQTLRNLSKRGVVQETETGAWQCL